MLGHARLCGQQRWQPGQLLLVLHPWLCACFGYAWASASASDAAVASAHASMHASNMLRRFVSSAGNQGNTLGQALLCS
jgi:hypothetical protein